MKILVTGGAGFLGSHTAGHFAKYHDVKILDNLSRAGTEANLKWLQDQYQLEHFNVDIRDSGGVTQVMRDFRPDAVIHLAAQVAVTTSVTDPRQDFEINALGTLNVLEAVRQFCANSAVLFSSTNKVYGDMEDLEVYRDGTRYKYRDLPYGADESRPLDFHSPYGCSKGAADQYVRDYYRIYDIPTVAFRQSCCYGTRQFGVEDQGWLAWFIIRAVLGQPVSIFGDGAQVRDILWAEDLVAAYAAALDKIDQVAGSVYNLGGGVESQLSLLELVTAIKDVCNLDLEYDFQGWRPGDQKVFIADTRKIQTELGWQPKKKPMDGIREIFEWVQSNRGLFERLGQKARKVSSSLSEIHG